MQTHNNLSPADENIDDNSDEDEKCLGSVGDMDRGCAPGVKDLPTLRTPRQDRSVDVGRGWEGVALDGEMRFFPCRVP